MSVYKMIITVEHPKAETGKVLSKLVHKLTNALLNEPVCAKALEENPSLLQRVHNGEVDIFDSELTSFLEDALLPPDGESYEQDIEVEVNFAEK